MTKRRSSLVDAATTADSKTFNGGATNSTSLDACVDMFFLAGASRTMSEQSIINIFSKAFAEDKDMAMKILFWSRDIRGGAGERHFFQVVTKWLEATHPKSLYKNMKYVPEYGRWKDIFDFNPDVTIPIIKEGLLDGIKAKEILEKLHSMSEVECGEVLREIQLSK